MIKNFIKIAWRNLYKNKVYSLINILGLSLSVAFCLLLFFYIRREQSFDSFHQKKDRLYRLEMSNFWDRKAKKEKAGLFSFITKSDDVSNMLVFPLVVAEEIKGSLPELKAITRFKDDGTELVKAKNETFQQAHVLYADPNFFSTFSFHLIQGDPKTILSNPSNAIVSKTVAHTYFGSEDPIGKTIKLISDSNRLFTVAGIVEDAPLNSSIQYGMILPLVSHPNYERNLKEHYNHMNHLFILELAAGTDPKQFENKLNRWVSQNFTPSFIREYQMKDYRPEDMHWQLRPLSECHYNASAPWGHYTNSKSIYLLGCLVIVILLIASLNYVLLAISTAASRTQEVGLRKVMGANRRSIILQCWIETQIIAALAVLGGFLLALGLLPLFNSVVGTDLKMQYFSIKEVLPTLLLLCFSLGILAGYYPALLISSMKTLSVIKSFQTFKVNPRLSSVLVVLQYTACVVMMVAGFVITRQMRYVTQKDLGFDKEQVLMVENPTWDFNFTKKLHERLRVFAASQPGISQYSAMNGGLDGSYNMNGFLLNGKQQFRSQLTVDYNYFEMLDLDILQGRSFSRAFPSDSASKPRACVVNETLFNMLGKTAVLGRYNEPLGEVIIGVVKDYNFESLSKKIGPQDHVLAKDFVMNFMFKIRPGYTQEVIGSIEKEWKQTTHNYPFQYHFLDQSIAKMYEADTRWQKIIQASCFFAILIACMGLFGLSAINAGNRTKEIGIRKVLGATLQDIVTSLSKSFVFMVCLSILIATPLSWWMMNSWLQDFAYRIQLSWWTFGIVGLVALGIAMGTVSYQALKAARSNPVRALRNE
jgi:putative ABC transport system permease protein